MITKFNTFLNEALGVNSDVKILTEYIFNTITEKYDTGIKIFKQKKITLKNINLPLSFKINKIVINFKKIKPDHLDSGESASDAYFSYDSKIKKDQSFNLYITYNTDNEYFSRDLIRHEILHAFVFTKIVDDYKNSDYILMKFLNLSTPNEKLKEFQDIIYRSLTEEIAAFFNQDVDVFEYQQQEQNNLDFNSILNESYTVANYNIVKNFDIKKEFNQLKIHEKFELISFIEVYNSILNKYPIVDDEYIDMFINRLEKTISDRKKLYLKYIGRLRILFE